MLMSLLLLEQNGQVLVQGHKQQRNDLQHIEYLGKDASMHIKVVIALFFLLITLPSYGYAVTYYAEKTATCAGCSDANSCATAQTITTGKATINAGISCLAAGDTLEVGTGTYDELIRTHTGFCTGYTCNLVPSGTGSGARTTLKAQAGEAPILRPLTGGNSAVIYIGSAAGTGKQWIDIGAVGQGFDIDAGPCSGNPGTTGTCTGVNVGENSNITTNNIRIIGNTIHHAHSATGTGCVLIRGGANNITVTRNTMHDCGRNRSSHGIYNSTNNNTLTYNTITDSGGANIHNFCNGTSIYQTCSDNTICWNTLRRNGRYDPGNPVSNVVLSGDRNLLCSNIITESVKHAVVIQYNTPNDNKVYNNTIYDATDYGILQTDTFSSPLTGNDIKNNIVRNTLAPGIQLSGTVTGTLSATNLGCGTKTAAGVGCELTSNPLLVAPPSNVHLNTGSPAIDYGTNLIATVATDIAGLPYSDPMEAGAYDFAEVAPRVLVFTTPPQSSVEGTTMLPVVAAVQDSNGVLQTTHANNCVIAKQSGPGTLSGTTNVAPSSGICTWSTLSIDTDGTYTLVATSPGSPTVTQVISPSFTVTNAVTTFTHRKVYMIQ
jgi:hypothetical protein